MGTAGLGERIAAVRARIAKACQRCGRDPSTVTLVAVTKGITIDTVRDAIACSLTHLGENRIQEARAKIQDSRFRMQASGMHLPPVRWHLIGHLQRNKAKDAVEFFETIHSLDSAMLAEELERHAEKRARSIEVLIQVNVSGESTKFGCRPDETPTLVQAIRRLPHLRLQGLMTMAPFSDNPDAARPVFRRLRALRDAADPSLKLSMGMSQDFEAAIEEGADYLRIGTAIFGA